MLEEAHKGKGPPPQVIPSNATRPVTRPPRPGTGRAVQKSKTSNLEAFKEELKRYYSACDLMTREYAESFASLEYSKNEINERDLEII